MANTGLMIILIIFCFGLIAGMGVIDYTYKGKIDKAVEQCKAFYKKQECQDPIIKYLNISFNLGNESN